MTTHLILYGQIGLSEMHKFRLIDSYPNKEEIDILDEKVLQHALKNFLAYGTRVVILESPGSGSLTIGVGSPYGFVEYMNENNDPPYLVATERETKPSDSFLEFDAGGTLTPISKNKCLPLEIVIDISVYFFKNKRLPEYINWQVN